MSGRSEETLTFPAAWYPLRFPRRGSRGLSAWGPEAALERMPDEFHRNVDTALDHELTTEEFRTAGRAWLAGDPDAPPLGAAVVAVAGTRGHSRRLREEACHLVHGWIARRGTEFAVRAAVEALTLTFDFPGGRPTGRTSPFVRRLELTAADQSVSGYHIQSLTIAAVVRAVLAGAPEPEYAAMVRVLGEYRAGDLQRRVATSFLAPSETAWVDADIAELTADGRDLHRPEQWLMLSIGSVAQAKALRADRRAGLVFQGQLLYTVFEGLGAETADIAAAIGTYGYRGATTPGLNVLSVIPTDHAFRLLLGKIDGYGAPKVVLKAAKRFPRRGVRLLAEAAGTAPEAAEVLKELVRSHPGVAAEVLPELPEEAAARVRPLLPQTSAPSTVDEIVPDGLPAILVRPPWTDRRKPPAPVVVPGIAGTDPPAMAWRPGERDAWRTHPLEVSRGDGAYFTRIAEEMRTGRAQVWAAVRVIAHAPEEIVRPVLPDWRPAENYLYDAASWTRVAVGRFELDALPLVLACAARSPISVAGSLAPFAVPEVATRMAEWLGKGRALRATARAWLERHAALAARTLVPQALGKPGPARRQAERALTLLAAGHRDEVTTAAKSYGPGAAAGIEALLAVDPLTALPAKLPTLPDWADPGLHPPVRLRAGGAVPAPAVRHIQTMLAISRPDEPYAGLDAVRAACDPASLAAFAWSLAERWRDTGGASKESWAFDALAHFGDDDTARRLAAQIRVWPGEGQHARAVAGLDVLAAIGTDVALMHLCGIAQKVPFSGLRKRAGEKVDEVAAGLGLSTEELADRLVPDFGLDADGGLTLDYGARRFRVGFDERLKPFVVDGAGKRRAALPKPGARDDATLAPAAYKRFADLKKDVRTVADTQVLRLERAMVTGRRWRGADFRRFVVAHPLVWHLARRLVWGRFDASGEFRDGLRIAEDRSFADVHDDPLVLADDDLIGVAHPVQIGAALPAWGELFADYELLQPFPQVGRETYALGADERGVRRLARFEGRTLSTGRVLSLEKRGWRRGAPQDAGVQCWMERDVPAGKLIVELDPGIAIGAFDADEGQEFERVWLSGPQADRWDADHGRTLDALDAVTASEIIRDLEEVTSV